MNGTFCKRTIIKDLWKESLMSALSKRLYVFCLGKDFRTEAIALKFCGNSFSKLNCSLSRKRETGVEMSVDNCSNVSDNRNRLHHGCSTRSNVTTNT